MVKRYRVRIKLAVRSCILSAQHREPVLDHRGSKHASANTPDQPNSEGPAGGIPASFDDKEEEFEVEIWFSHPRHKNDGITHPSDEEEVKVLQVRELGCSDSKIMEELSRQSTTL